MIKIFFALYDFWIGVYWDRHKSVLYICPFPTVVIQFDINKIKEKINENRITAKYRKR